ncbi:MAG: fumarate hydratase C-terminal domain-containing protein [Candidatus Altiarchaeota archaeon]|nr:fumarate hydratase C-terminal domain-containing protein [Candidatus Altiarchaeota archaeon]
MITLKTPLSESDIEGLNAGDIIHVSGLICTARDKAHQKALKEDVFPVKIEGGIIFHSGPVVERENDSWRIIAIGPTTSSRMNVLEPEFIERFKVRAIIGKGGMNEEVRDSLKKNKAVYLSMTGGCAASAAEKIKEITGVYWLELGIPEAVWVLRVEHLGPLIVSIDSKGNSLYEKVAERVRRNL